MRPCSPRQTTTTLFGFGSGGDEPTTESPRRANRRMRSSNNSNPTGEEDGRWLAARSEQALLGWALEKKGTLASSRSRVEEQTRRSVGRCRTPDRTTALGAGLRVRWCAAGSVGQPDVVVVLPVLALHMARSPADLIVPLPRPGRTAARVFCNGRLVPLQAPGGQPQLNTFPT